ncbi:hypothetical protein GA0116948_10822 [Chitinophaga costaii]|uniref:Uncharacterized protein n=1 Tax=Chitinophaga costaii TaxID=1335309 RepID=A0A1C4ED61_9BACT|nr:hypothetical protein [Chitinophaga costaii]SCC41485.1 hypothetical protein GA0116948_10822 [Chitinophaga costaii]
MLSTNSYTQDTTDRDNWFDTLIASIKADKLMLDTNTAPLDKIQQYAVFMQDNVIEVANFTKKKLDALIVSEIIVTYFKLLKETSGHPKKLALDLNMRQGEILTWIEIGDGQEDFEDELLLIQAQINAKYHTAGYDMTATIVEESDHLTIPAHYKVIL